MNQKVEHPVTSVNVRPEVTILSVLRHLNYKPWFALAEFVDNSIQSAQGNANALIKNGGGTYRLRVEIEIDRVASTMTVRDNASGIARGDFPRAFRPAELPVDRSGLSEFGMGMKSAACWFTNRWRVTTKALGESVERIVDFEIDRIVSTKADSILVKENPASTGAHYTEIRLFDLGDRLPQTKTLKKIRDHLSGIYREFLRTGELELIVDTEALLFEEPEILVASPFDQPSAPMLTWRKDIQFDFGMGLSVSGFAALRKTGSTTHAGFALFRRKRLIEGSGDETYRPVEIFGNSNSYRYQRLFGELHLEGFEVSHTKDGFRWKDSEETFLELLRDYLKAAPLDLLTQAEGFRTLQSRKTLAAQAESAAERVAEAVREDAPQLLEQQQTAPLQDISIPQSLEGASPVLGERRVMVDAAGERWEIIVRCMIDSAVTDLVRIANRDAEQDLRPLSVNHLEIELNLGHPFARNYAGANGENVDLLTRVAAALCLGEVLAAHTRPEAIGRVLLHFNDVIRKALSNVQP